MTTTVTTVESVKHGTLLDLEKVKTQVLTYLQERGNANNSDILFDLGLDPDTVLDALDILKEESKIGCRNVQTTNKQ